jgi:hypothetical protein
MLDVRVYHSGVTHEHWKHNFQEISSSRLRHPSCPNHQLGTTYSTPCIAEQQPDSPVAIAHSMCRCTARQQPHGILWVPSIKAKQGRRMSTQQQQRCSLVQISPRQSPLFTSSLSCRAAARKYGLGRTAVSLLHTGRQRLVMQRTLCRCSSSGRQQALPSPEFHDVVARGSCMLPAPATACHIQCSAEAALPRPQENSGEGVP